MRFSSTALVALPAVLLASSSTFSGVSANECTCPTWTDGGNNGGSSSSNNGGNYGGNNGGGNNDWWAPAVKPIKYVPKVEATKENLQNGAADAIKQLTDSKLVPDG